MSLSPLPETVRTTTFSDLNFNFFMASKACADSNAVIFICKLKRLLSQ